MHGGVEGGRGDEERERHRLARPGLAAEQQVALGQPDRDRVAVLVDPEGERLPQRARRAPGHGGAGDRQRVAQEDRDVGQRGVGGVAHDPDVARTHGGGQRLARLVEQLGGEPGRQAKAQPLPGRDQPRCLRSAGSGRGG